jgi:hypothetical protein
VPAAVEAWLVRLLAKTPEQRYASMADVVAAARGLETGAGAGAGAFASPVATLPLLPASMSAAASQHVTTFSEQAAEKLATSHSPRFKRAVVAIGLLAVAGIAGAVLVTRAGGLPSSDPTAKEGAAGASAPEEAAQVTVSVSDAPEGLSVWLDGEASTLPVTLARDRSVHELTFRAPGYKERVMRLDASTSRVVTLAMQPLAAAMPQPAVAPPPAAAPTPSRRSPQPVRRSVGKPRERRPTGVPDLIDDVRKL